MKIRTLREARTSHLDGVGPRADSFAALVAEFAGCLSGPSDLSTNPKYMEGFGESRTFEPPRVKPGRTRAATGKARKARVVR